MRRRLLLGGIALLLAAVVCGIAQGVGAQADRDSKPDLPALERKLNAVMAAQEVILQKLDAMAEELRVIKVRVTVGNRL